MQEGSDPPSTSKPSKPSPLQGLTEDAGRDGGKDKGEQEVEAEESERRRLLGAVQVVEEAGIGDDADGKQVLRQRVPHRLQRREVAADAAWWRSTAGGCSTAQQQAAETRHMNRAASCEQGTRNPAPNSSRSCPWTGSKPCQRATHGTAASAGAGAGVGVPAIAGVGPPAGAVSPPYCCGCRIPGPVALVGQHTGRQQPSVLSRPLRVPGRELGPSPGLRAVGSLTVAAIQTDTVRIEYLTKESSETRESPAAHSCCAEQWCAEPHPRALLLSR